ncbi:MAG: hypothetical protein ACYS9X_02750 [Planctomycetota bacterium]|jgi:hypothetical protein
MGKLLGTRRRLIAATIVSIVLLTLAATAVYLAVRSDFHFPAKLVGRYEWEGSSVPFSVTLDVTRVEQTGPDTVEFWGTHTYVLEVEPLDGVDRPGISGSIYVMQVKGTIDRPSRRITLTERGPSRPDAVTAGRFEGTVSDDLAVIEATWTTEGTGERGVLSLRSHE